MAGGFFGVAIICVLQIGSRSDQDKEPVTRKAEIEWGDCLSKANPQMLPKRNREYRENELHIISVDDEARTIHAQINGCTITAVCREKSNPDIYESIKGILIQSAIE